MPMDSAVLSLLPKLSELDRARLEKVRFILTDVDDTITWESKLPPETYQALYELFSAGYIIIPVTGGCAGWSDLIARLWPVAGVITEGGACFLSKSKDGKLDYQYWTEANEMHQQKEQLLSKVEKLLVKYPRLKLAQDQAYRLTDVAVDYAQDVFPPALEEKEAFLLELAKSGLQAKASSIHINIWHGDYDKYAMAERVLRQEYGLSDEAMREQVVYIGDAPNDESMFAKFPMGIGVANISQHLNNMHYQPCCITKEMGGYGFAEVARHLLAVNHPIQ